MLTTYCPAAAGSGIPQVKAELNDAAQQRHVKVSHLDEEIFATATDADVSKPLWLQSNTGSTADYAGAGRKEKPSTLAPTTEKKVKVQ